MLTNKQCNNKYNAKPMSWVNVKDEFIELLVEIKDLNKDGIVEEFKDTMYTLFCAIDSNLNITLPMMFEKDIEKKIGGRFKVWEKIFKENNLDFNKKYLSNGSNYEKQHKVDAALKLAREDQM